MPAAVEHVADDEDLACEAHLELDVGEAIAVDGDASDVGKAFAFEVLRVELVQVEAMQLCL